MPLGRLKKYLDDNNVKYVIKSHSIAYTAPEIAALAHVPGKEWAKTVILNIDGKLAMAILPASSRIDFEDFKKAVGVKNIQLATEDEFKNQFADCEVGAMPPFGNLYDMDVYVAESLAEDDEITFNACSHNQSMQMAFKDFKKLVQPKIVKFSYKN